MASKTDKAVAAVVGLGSLAALIFALAKQAKAAPWDERRYVWDERCDLNGDGQVTALDHSWFTTFYNKPVDPANPKSRQADFNGDGFVGKDDLDYFMAHYLMVRPT